MRMKASSEKCIAGAPSHITIPWLGALPNTDALMKAYVPKCVSLMLAIVKICYSCGYVLVLCFGVLPFQSCFIDSVEAKWEQEAKTCLIHFVSDSWINFMMLNSSYETFTLKNFQFAAFFQSVLNIKYHSNIKTKLQAQCFYNIFALM